MHWLLVCVSALCFFWLCVEGPGTPLCRDCRVHVIYPGGQQLARNQRIVRIINDYRRVGWEQARLQDWDFSFIAKVMVAGSIRCSAALVAPRVVITSSACFKIETEHQLQILFSRGRTRGVDLVLKPEFCPELSLLHLGSRSEIQPVDISHKSPKLGNNLSMLMASQNLSFYGRRRTQIIENRACKANFLEEESAYITASMVCARNSVKPERCTNNAGDTLLMDHQLCGINAYGSRCRPNSLNGDIYIDLTQLQPMIGNLIRHLNG